jgi:hypothetical protein
MSTELVRSKTPDNLALFVSGSMELLELLQFREDTAADPDATTAEIVETLKACDARIEDYVRQQITQVDGVASYLHEFNARITALKAEKTRLGERIVQWETRRERIEQVIERVMQSLGKKKLEGSGSTMALHKNPASVEVPQPDLVPAQYKLVDLTMSVALFEALVKVLMKDDKSASVLAELLQVKRSEPKLSKSAIAAELKASCPKCNGVDKDCKTCGGSGKCSVPGARLVTDRVHLEIK